MYSSDDGEGGKADSFGVGETLSPIGVYPGYLTAEMSSNVDELVLKTCWTLRSPAAEESPDLPPPSTKDFF